MSRTPAALDDHAFLSALLNIALPPSADGKHPGAGTLGLQAAVATGARGDSMLGPMVESGAQAVREAALAGHPEGLAGMSPEDGTKVVQAQFSANPMFMMGLLRYLYPAYYGHPQVLETIGEPPRPPFPLGFDVQPTDPELLKTLEARRKS